MLPVLQFIAIMSCVHFSGAAIYISLVEHPARMGCDTRTAAAVWAPSYRRGAVMQAPLAILSVLAGVEVWSLGGGMMWLVAAVLIGLVAPFTFIAIMPANHQLLAPGRDFGSRETRALLERWGRLHAVRSVLGFIASVVYVGLLVGI